MLVTGSSQCRVPAFAPWAWGWHGEALYPSLHPPPTFLPGQEEGAAHARTECGLLHLSVYFQMMNWMALSPLGVEAQENNVLDHLRRAALRSSAIVTSGQESAQRH